jgi:flavin-dependent thymidylate synthase
MIIKIAGYNIDKSLIEQLPNQNIATPETISAAYARISRSKKSVTELRETALQEVEKARASNENIIFEMGHSSVAEHAVFNFDIIGVSRYLVEVIQRTRLASFTEKSQRYVTLDGDYIIPKEIKGTTLEKDFNNIIAMQINLYNFLYESGKDYLEKNNFAGTQKELYGKAKEDARYVLALATETQLGMTINARSISKLLRRLDAIDLMEAKELKQKIESLVKEIAPSLVRYTSASEYEKNVISYFPDIKHEYKTIDCALIQAPKHADREILKSMAFEKLGLSEKVLTEWVNGLDETDKADIFNSFFAEMKSFDTVPRSFEIADFVFEFSISSCCFGQLKRHRMSTILRSDYHPDLGYVIPPFIQEINACDEIKIVMKSVNKLYEKLQKTKPGLGNYILTNAHRVNVVFKANLRELYHFSRLRSDKHAQWEIQELSQKIEMLVKDKAPLAASRMMGKDKFNSL